MEKTDLKMLKVRNEMVKVHFKEFQNLVFVLSRKSGCPLKKNL